MTYSVDGWTAGLTALCFICSINKIKDIRLRQSAQKTSFIILVSF